MAQTNIFQSGDVGILFLRSKKKKKKAKITEDYSRLHPWEQKQVQVTPLLRIL